MKKIYFLLLLIAASANAQIVNIPDANFKAKLLAADVTNSIASTATNATIPNTFNKIDVNNDGEIQQSEAASVTLLNISSSNISDLTGIEAFVSLHVLKCQNNQITSLDVTNFTILVILECESNFIAELEVSNLIYLQSLICTDNQMTSLTLTNLPSLYNLYCGNNQLTSLNLSGLPSLFQLGCQGNQLTTLDASGLVNLEIIDCQSNQLTTLNVSNSSNLEWLSCSNNLFTTLDCNDNTALKALYMYGCPNIQTLFLHNGSDERTNMDSGSWFENWVACPNLQYICVDENEMQPLRDLIDSIEFVEIQPILINTYCSFTPGGSFNTLSGTVKFDADNNGCDASDVTYPNIKVNLSDGTNSYSTFTRQEGNYKFYVETGNFTVTPNIENQEFFTISPPSVTHNVAELTNDNYVQNFCLAPNGNHPALEIVIAPVTPARPGFDAVYKIVYKNTGNQTLSGNVNFYFIDGVLDFVNSNPIPDLQGNGLLKWNYINLSPFESRSILVTLNVNAPTETPAVNIGDELFFNATTNPVDGNEVFFSYAQTVVGSFDPNDITCLEGDIVAPTEIGNYLHYIVNFENTGTAAAENIVVKVVIDPTQFDVSSLQLLNVSHPVQAKVTGNIVEFIFEGIFLDTGGHGNILLKIKSAQNLAVGAIVTKQADIFFDYNFPIATNPASTAFQVLSVGDVDLGKAITIYPNPATDIINVKANNMTLKSLQLYDVQGRLLINRLMENEASSVDISSYSSGIYYLKVITDKGSTTQKIVKK